MISGTQIYFTLLFASSYKSWRCIFSFWKSDFLGYCSFTQLFYHLDKFRRKPKIFVKAIQRFCHVQHVGLISKKNQPYAAKVSTLVKFTHFSTLLNTYVYPHVSFSALDIVKERWNISSTSLDDWNNNFFFWLKVWLFGGWAKTSFNQFDQKPSKNTLHGYWN